MKTVSTYQEFVNGVSLTKDSETRNVDIVVEGEVFEEKIFENAIDDLRTRITFKEIGTDKQLGEVYFPSMSKEHLELEVKNACKNAKTYINGIS